MAIIRVASRNRLVEYLHQFGDVDALRQAIHVMRMGVDDDEVEEEEEDADDEEGEGAAEDNVNEEENEVHDEDTDDGLDGEAHDDHHEEEVELGLIEQLVARYTFLGIEHFEVPDGGIESLLEEDDGFTLWQLLSQLHENSVLWTAQNCFIGTAASLRLLPAGEERITVIVGNNDDHLGPFLRIHSPTAEQASTTMEGLAKLLAQSDLAKVWFIGRHNETTLSISSQTLKSLIGSVHCGVDFGGFFLSEEQCGILAQTSERVLVQLCNCVLEDEGEAFVASIGSNSGLSRLSLIGETPMLSPVNRRNFVNGLRRNTHLKRLDFNPLQFMMEENECEQMIQALGENKGLEEFQLIGGLKLSNAVFGQLTTTLSTHPSLWRILFQHAVPFLQDDVERSQVRLSRNQMFVRMLDTNENITDLELLTGEDRDEETWNREIAPRLRINPYKKRASAIARAAEDMKPGLLGRALGKVKDDPGLLWVFVSRNAPLLAKSLDASNDVL